MMSERSFVHAICPSRWHGSSLSASVWSQKSSSSLNLQPFAPLQVAPTTHLWFLQSSCALPSSEQAMLLSVSHCSPGVAMVASHEAVVPAPTQPPGPLQPTATYLLSSPQRSAPSFVQTTAPDLHFCPTFGLQPVETRTRPRTNE